MAKPLFKRLFCRLLHRKIEDPAEVLAALAAEERQARDDVTVRRMADELDVQRRSLPVEDAGDFIEFIRRLTFEKYETLHDTHDEDAQSTPLWYEFYEREIDVLRKRLRNPEAPNETLSMLARRLAVYYAGVPIIAGGAAFGVAAGAIATLQTDILSLAGDAFSHAFSFSITLTIIAVGLIIAELQMISYAAVETIGAPVRTQIGRVVANARAGLAAIGGAGLGFFLLLLSASIFSALFGDASGQPAVLSAATLFAIASAGGILALGVSWRRFFHFLLESEEFFKLRVVIRTALSDNDSLVGRYLERSKLQDPARAPDGHLKQRLISRLNWDFLYFIPRMYMSARVDVIDLGYEEAQNLFRRWRWIYASGAAVLIGVALTQPTQDPDGVYFAAYWLFGGAAFLFAAWAALRWAIRLANHKLERARAIVKPKLAPGDWDTFGLDEGSETFNWKERYELDDLLIFSRAYQRTLLDLDDLKHYGKRAA